MLAIVRRNLGAGAWRSREYAQFVPQPGIFLRGRGLLGDRCIVRGET